MMLHIKRRSLRLASLLYYGGLVVMILSIPYLLFRMSHTDALLTEAWMDKTAFSLILPGCIMSSVGGAWEYRLYRCPKCREGLLKGAAFSQKAPNCCPKCGEKISVCIDDR